MVLAAGHPVEIKSPAREGGADSEESRLDHLQRHAPVFLNVTHSRMTVEPDKGRMIS